MLHAPGNAATPLAVIFKNFVNGQSLPQPEKI
jgi:hypothetical protein